MQDISTLNVPIKADAKELGTVKGVLNEISGALTGVAKEMKAMSLGTLGLGFSIKSLVTSSFNLNQTLLDQRQALQSLSDASGNAGKALQQNYEIFSMTGGSLDTIRANMLSLNQSGILPTTKNIKHLTAFVTDMALATGIGADTFTSFAGTMVRDWQMGVKATEEMTSSVIALGDGFNMTALQVGKVMDVTSEAMKNMGGYFKDGEKSARALTKGISGSVGALSKLGVSAQVATDFISKLVDPANFEQNFEMLSRMGISFQEQMDMLESGGGKEMFFDKMMTNLPTLAKQIQSVTNPIARMDFAKSMGVPMEIAMKLSKATAGEVQNIMADYKQKAKDDEAAKKKQEKMAGESARFEDTLHILKMKALMPIMQFVNENLGTFMDLLKGAADLFRGFTEWLRPIMQMVTDNFRPFIDALSGGDAGTIIKTFFISFVGAIKDVAKYLWKTITEEGPGIILSIFEMLRDTFNDLADYISNKGPALLDTFKETLKPLSKIIMGLLKDGIFLLADQLPMGGNFLKGLVRDRGDMSKSFSQSGYAAKSDRNEMLDIMSKGGGMSFDDATKDQYGKVIENANKTLRGSQKRLDNIAKLYEEAKKKNNKKEMARLEKLGIIEAKKYDATKKGLDGQLSLVRNMQIAVKSGKMSQAQAQAQMKAMLAAGASVGSAGAAMIAAARKQEIASKGLFDKITIMAKWQFLDKTKARKELGLAADVSDEELKEKWTIAQSKKKFGKQFEKIDREAVMQALTLGSEKDALSIGGGRLKQLAMGQTVAGIKALRTQYTEGKGSDKGMLSLFNKLIYEVQQSNKALTTGNADRKGGNAAMRGKMQELIDKDKEQFAGETKDWISAFIGNVSGNMKIDYNSR